MVFLYCGRHSFSQVPIFFKLQKSKKKISFLLLISTNTLSTIGGKMKRFMLKEKQELNTTNVIFDRGIGLAKLH